MKDLAFVVSVDMSEIDDEIIADMEDVIAHAVTENFEVGVAVEHYDMHEMELP